MTIFDIKAIVLLLATVTLLCCFGNGSGTEKVRIGKPRDRQATKFKTHGLGKKKHDQGASQKLKGQLKLSIKDFFPDDEFSIKVPHLNQMGLVLNCHLTFRRPTFPFVYGRPISQGTPEVL